MRDNLYIRLSLLLALSLNLSSCVYHTSGWMNDLWNQTSPQSARATEPSAEHVSAKLAASPLEPSKTIRTVEILPPPSLSVTPEVERELAQFTGRNARFVPNSIERMRGYLPMVSRIFAEEGVPIELVGVGVIESGFVKDAKSYSGAVGIWQFMKGTARLYGLSVGWLADERRDPERSTRAAAQHLRDLYQAYDDWYLALAAYNLGSAGVDRAIQRGGSKDFWTLSRRGAFREQTRRYVPKYIAATILLQRDLGKDLK